MGSQYHYFPEEVDVKYSPNHAVVVTPGYQMNGGFALDRVSNTSTDSQPSYSSENCLSPISPSPGNDMSSYSPLYGTNPMPQQQYDSSYSSFQQTENVRHTPTSLGWGIQGADLVKLYKFIVPKGKLPYLELLEKWTPTYETPFRVYLDEPTGYKKNQFPCQYPGSCNGKQNVFGRPADLERHYKNVHASEKDSFPCDYPKCPRSQDSFSRKDHYRDHLRDFHKEDIGCAKGEKSSRDKEKHKWQKAQKIWLSERVISHKHWRCARCLVKNYVTQQGWECSSCKSPCEEDRVTARRRLDPGRRTPVDPSEVTMEDGYTAPIPYGACVSCNGSTWVHNGYDAYVSCPTCQPAAEPFPYGNIAYN